MLQVSSRIENTSTAHKKLLEMLKAATFGDTSLGTPALGIWRLGELANR